MDRAGFAIGKQSACRKRRRMITFSSQRLDSTASHPMPVQLTRRVRFSAAHRYFRPDWSDERNRSVFGACANPHGHGHNYMLEATVEGAVDPETGFLVDLGWLDALLPERVVGPL